MKEQLENALVDILTKATSTVGEATEFLKGELPEVARELITYNLWLNGLQIVLWFFISLYFLHVLRRFSKKDSKEMTSGEAIGGLVSFFSIIFSIASFFFSIGPFLKCWLAPRVFLIEYASSLIR